MKGFIAIGIFLLSGILFGQKDFKEYEKTLARYNDYFVNAEDAEHRLFAYNKFKLLFEEVLKKDSSYYYSFDSLKWILKVMSPDSSFRIFTWQIQSENGVFDYYGYVQKNDGKLFKLKDNKQEFPDLEYEFFSNNDWYGQMYYNVIQYIKDSITAYLVFGYRLSEKGKIKTAEPLEFSNEEIVFGKPVFEDTLREGLLKNRIVLNTSRDAASKLNYDSELGIIIYDHTIKIPVHNPEKEIIAIVPDGSYHGYRWDGKKWAFINKVFNEVYNENMIPVRSKNDKNVDPISGEKINK